MSPTETSLDIDTVNSEVTEANSYRQTDRVTDRLMDFAVNHCTLISGDIQMFLLTYVL